MEEWIVAKLISQMSYLVGSNVLEMTSLHAFFIIKTIIMTSEELSHMEMVATTVNLLKGH